MFCFLFFFLQVIGLLLPNQTLLSAVFWQVNTSSTGSSFCGATATVMERRAQDVDAHLSTSLFCLTDIKPESQRLFQLLQPQCFSGSAQNTKGCIYHKWLKQKLIVLSFPCSLLHFPDSSRDTPEPWPVRSPLLWVPIIPLAWRSNWCHFTIDLQHSLREHYTLKVLLETIFKVRLWRMQLLNVCQV